MFKSIKKSTLFVHFDLKKFQISFQHLNNVSTLEQFQHLNNVSTLEQFQMTMFEILCTIEFFSLTKPFTIWCSLKSVDFRVYFGIVEQLF